jgi:hypothetical protein
MLHIVVVRPIPSARATIEIAARPGCFTSILKPCLRSARKYPIGWLRVVRGSVPAYAPGEEAVSSRNCG